MSTLDVLVGISMGVDQMTAWYEEEAKKAADGLPNVAEDARAGMMNARKMFDTTFTPELVTRIILAADQSAQLATVGLYTRIVEVLQRRVDDLAEQQRLSLDVRAMSRTDEAANCRDIVRTMQTRATKPPGTPACWNCSFYDGDRCGNLKMAGMQYDGPLYFRPPTASVPNFGCALFEERERQ